MATRETAKILTRGAHPSSVAEGPHHLLGAESLPPLRNPLNSPGTHPGTNLQPHPPTTITTVAFKRPLVKGVWRTPSSGGHRTESLKALSMQGSAAFPGLFCSCYTNIIRQTINLLYT